MLPPQFGRPYFVPSPHPTLASVLRANCSNPGCSVRAVVHIERDESGRLKIRKEKPIFDRQKNPCDECKKLFTNSS
jgi:formamidopyrimidine-DNA glycosylase